MCSHALYSCFRLSVYLSTEQTPSSEGSSIALCRRVLHTVILILSPSLPLSPSLHFLLVNSLSTFACIAATVFTCLYFSLLSNLLLPLLEITAQE